MRGWRVNAKDNQKKLPDGIHVMPDWEDHDMSPDCWCGPVSDDDPGCPIYTHRDELKRSGPTDPDDA